VKWTKEKPWLAGNYGYRLYNNRFNILEQPHIYQCVFPRFKNSRDNFLFSKIIQAFFCRVLDLDKLIYSNNKLWTWIIKIPPARNLIPSIPFLFFSNVIQENEIIRLKHWLASSDCSLFLSLKSDLPRKHSKTPGKVQFPFLVYFTPFVQKS
jgi:hypothetical protein